MVATNALSSSITERLLIWQNPMSMLPQLSKLLKPFNTLQSHHPFLNTEHIFIKMLVIGDLSMIPSPVI